MLISQHINPEFINTSLDPLLEDMPSKSLDGEMMELTIIGSLPTHGTQIGVTKVISGLPSENVESIPSVLPVMYDQIFEKIRYIFSYCFTKFIFLKKIFFYFL